MVEFNSDGSIKLPSQFAKQAEENKEKLRSQRCIKIRKDVASFRPPKKCVLRVAVSDVFPDSKFIETIFREFNENSSTPCKIVKINERELEIEIGTEFRRCTECCSLVNKYREFLEGNLIEDKGSCTFEQNRNFCYEDYF